MIIVIICKCSSVTRTYSASNLVVDLSSFLRQQEIRLAFGCCLAPVHPHQRQAKSYACDGHWLTGEMPASILIVSGHACIDRPRVCVCCAVVFVSTVVLVSRAAGRGPLGKHVNVDKITYHVCVKYKVENRSYLAFDSRFDSTHLYSVVVG